jgi:hypothetical protein
MTRKPITFAGEAAKYRMDHVEGWLRDAERVCRETAEALVRQADSCALAAATVAEYRQLMDELEEVEALAGGPARLRKESVA